MKNIIRNLFLILLYFGITHLSAQNMNECNVAGKGDTIFAIAEQMPQFPGGETELLKFIQKTLKYPAIAIENGISGKDLMQFVVGCNGKISNIEFVGKKIGWGCDEEAIRIIKAMPDWIPGKQNGKTVNVRFIIPIKFEYIEPVAEPNKQ